MGVSPYRVNSPENPRGGRGPAGDRDLMAAFGLVWLVSLACSLAQLRARKPFGAEATLALGVVVLIPVLVLRGRRRRS